MPLSKVGEKTMVETKSVVKSKLNWLGVGLTVLGVLSDPQAQALMGDFLPTSIVSKIMSASGLLLIGLRTWGTHGPVGR